MLYFTLKTLHIIAVISWMAGVLYMYRLLVNITDNLDSEDNKKLLFGMARRLYRIITVPALMVTWVAGFAIVFTNPSLIGGWFHVKFLFVIFLTVATIYSKRLLIKFENNDKNLPSSKKLRLLNEVPTLLMIVIVVLVVFKPF